MAGAGEPAAPADRALPASLLQDQWGRAVQWDTPRQGGGEVPTEGAGAAGSMEPLSCISTDTWPFPGSQECCWLPYTSLCEPAEDGSDRHQLGQGSFGRCWDITPLKTGFTNGLMSRACDTGPCAAGPLMQCCRATVGQTEAACSTSST